MADNDIGNFSEGIHNEDYEQPFLSRQAGAESHIIMDTRSHVSTGSQSRTGEAARRKVSLNGRWHFGVDQYDTCLRQRWYEENYTDEGGRPYPVDFCFDRWDTISVPSCWNLHLEGHLGKDLYLYEGSCVYTRTFDFTPEPHERVFLRFGAANRTCKVFLNGQYLGMHTGGHTPFCFEVTEILRGGQGTDTAGTGKNRLIAVVSNTRRPTDVPTDNTDWFNYGGLYREVSLLRLPETFIKDFYIYLKQVKQGDSPHVSQNTKQGDTKQGDSPHVSPHASQQKINAAIKIDGPQQNGTATIAIPALDISVQVPIKDGSGEIEFEAAPQLWSPDNPCLYDVTVTCGEDILAERVGFRTIDVRDGCIFLNGEEIYLKGVCTHEESVRNGNAVTEDEIRANFALAKEMGCNFMRLAHYPHSEAAARIADEAGILLWEEIPVYWAIAFEREETYRNAENQLSELILRDRNRASVIIWSVGNENADTDARLRFMTRLTQKARELDPSRLVSAACLVDGGALQIRDRLAQELDIIGINEYYGWYEPDFSKLPKIFENSRPSKPVVITEFGADAKAGSGGSAGELYTEGNQKAVYEKQLEVLGKIPYVKGTAPWIFYDFRCPRRLHPMQNYYNIKGLLSADKSYKKPAFEVMKAFYKA